jgi:hypothetical protein
MTARAYYVMVLNDYYGTLKILLAAYLKTL